MKLTECKSVCCSILHTPRGHWGKTTMSCYSTWAKWILQMVLEELIQLHLGKIWSFWIARIQPNIHTQYVHWQECWKDLTMKQLSWGLHMPCPACVPTYLQRRRGENNLCMCKFSSAWRLVRAGQASHKGGSSWAPCHDAAIWEIRHHMETDRISVRGHRTARGQGDQGQRSTCT